MVEISLECIRFYWFEELEVRVYINIVFGDGGGCFGKGDLEKGVLKFIYEFSLNF